MLHLCFLVCFFIARIAAVEVNTSNANNSAGLNSIDCLYARRIVSYGNRLEKSTDVCFTTDNKQTLDLPDGLINQRSVVSGKSIVRIHGARIHRSRQRDSAATIDVQDNVTVEILARNWQTIGGETAPNQTRVVLVIRVTALDGQVTLNQTELGNYLFGDNGVNLKNVYGNCSFGKMNIVPYQGPGVVNGVAEFFYNNTVKERLPEVIDSVLYEPIRNLYGKEHSAYQNLFIMLPPGTTTSEGTPWYAFTYSGMYKSVFNNNMAGSVSAHVHELGHTLGLSHSGRGEDQYGDTTCNMGYSAPTFGSPAKCFNGHKNNFLGWYSDRKLEITSSSSLPWTGNLVTFVDYDKSYDNETVLIKINDMFLQYNRAKSFNFETGENQDEITITQAPWDITYSKAIASLSMSRKRFTILKFTRSKNLIVEVCSQQNVTENGRADLYRLSIFLSSQRSGCQGITQTNPPPPPTNPPTFTPPPRPSPTYNPARRHRPSKPPTTKPTVTTRIPSAPPTAKPIIATPNPTAIPSAEISIATAKPTTTLRRLPTRRPSRRQNNSPPPSSRPTVLVVLTPQPSHALSKYNCLDSSWSFQFQGRTRSCLWISMQSNKTNDRRELCNAIGPKAWTNCIKACFACI